MNKYSLKDTPILKLLMVYAGPAVIGLLINAFYNIIDRIFVSQFVGAEGLSAVTIAFPISLFQFGFVLLFGSGAGVLISKFLGEKDHDKAESTFGNMVAGLLITLIIFTSVGLLFCTPIMRIFGAEGELLKLSVEYVRIIILGFPLSFFIALEFTCRAEGNPRLPAILILISSLINITLDYLFMGVFNMGVEGAALATVIAQGINALCLLRYYLSGKSLIRWRWKSIRLQREIIIPILAIGLSPFIMDCSTSLQAIVANNLLLKAGGTYAVAAMGIIFGVNIIFLMIALGTGDGIQPIVSFNYGAKQPKRNRETVLYAMSAVGVISLLGLTAIELFPDLIIRIFIDDNATIIDIARTGLRIFALSIPFYMIQIVATRYFQAIHNSKIATFLALLRPIIIFIPIVYTFNFIWGLDGIWSSFVVSDLLSALISLVFIQKSIQEQREILR